MCQRASIECDLAKKVIKEKYLILRVDNLPKASFEITDRVELPAFRHVGEGQYFCERTHRAMLENARQGFWNGAVPPFGYATVVKERRGNKDKKVLVVNESEASVVRMIFELCLGADGPPLGVKAIANHLNTRGMQRRGRRFGTGSIHDLLKTSTYCGRHYFNQTDSRAKRRRPPSQWVELSVPPIISEEAFNRVQALLRARAPRVMAPRNVNGPTMLASVARCAGCGSAMILNTGKGGTYRYYSCSKAMKQGKTACQGRRIRMDRLDEMVLGHLSEKLFTPERLTGLLQGYIAQANEGRASQAEKLRQARDACGRVDAGMTRLLAMVENGAIEPDAPELRDRLVSLRLQKAELERDIGRLRQNLEGGQAELSPKKLQALALQMRQRLSEGPPDLRQAYMRLLLDRVTIDHHSIRLEGSPVILEKLANRGLSKSTPEVLSFVQEWRPQRDSNPCYQRERLVS